MPKYEKLDGTPCETSYCITGLWFTAEDLANVGLLRRKEVLRGEVVTAASSSTVSHYTTVYADFIMGTQDRAEDFLDFCRAVRMREQRSGEETPPEALI